MRLHVCVELYHWSTACSEAQAAGTGVAAARRREARRTRTKKTLQQPQKVRAWCTRAETRSGGAAASLWKALKLQHCTYAAESAAEAVGSDGGSKVEGNCD